MPSHKDTMRIKQMHRTLQILCLSGFELKMLDVQLQPNRCSECHSHNIEYPDNDPRVSLISCGEDPLFSCTGTIYWLAKCNDCGFDMPICVTYNYSAESGTTVTSQDFFLDHADTYRCSKFSR